MARAGAIEAEGVVVEFLANQRYRVELTNGHRLLAFVAGKAQLSFGGVGLGDRVRLELSPYDLSVGRIIVKAQTI